MLVHRNLLSSHNSVRLPNTSQLFLFLLDNKGDGKNKPVLLPKEIAVNFVVVPVSNQMSSEQYRNQTTFDCESFGIWHNFHAERYVLSQFQKKNGSLPWKLYQLRSGQVKELIPNSPEITTFSFLLKSSPKSFFTKHWYSPLLLELSNFPSKVPEFNNWYCTPYSTSSPLCCHLYSKGLVPVALQGRLNPEPDKISPGWSKSSDLKSVMRGGSPRSNFETFFSFLGRYRH